MDVFPSVTVIFNEKVYKILMGYEETVGDLKNKLHDLIKLNPASQKISNVRFNLLGDQSENDVKVRDILASKLYNPPVTRFVVEKVDGDFNAVRCVQTQYDESLATALPFEVAIDVIIPSQCATKGFKILSQPRPNKKLLILDIDDTLYDISIRHTKSNLAARPYLQELLRGVYPYYDLGLWSSTPMSSIERKVKVLGIRNKYEYKFMFYGDIQLTTFVDIPGAGKIRTKPLQKIYDQFKCYNKMNTIICDDRLANFYCNFNNGILVSIYSYINHHKDNELLLLRNYLKQIAKKTDISTLRHSYWKQLIQLRKKSSKTVTKGVPNEDTRSKLDLFDKDATTSFNTLDEELFKIETANTLLVKSSNGEQTVLSNCQTAGKTLVVSDNTKNEAITKPETVLSGAEGNNSSLVTYPPAEQNVPSEP